MTEELISLDEARSKGLPKYFTGIPCKHGHTDKRLTSTSACTECGRQNTVERKKADPQRAARAAKKWRMANPHKVREGNLARYGLTPQDFEALRTKQNNKCGVCDFLLSGKVCVDHCHVTGRVRGLLHNRCNTAIGLLNDDPQMLLRAVAYLRGSSR